MRIDRRRWLRLPLPNNALEDLGAGSPPPPPPSPGAPPEPAWYAKDAGWADASKDVDFAKWADTKKPKDALSAMRGHYEAEKLIGNSIQPWKEGEDPSQWPGWDKLGAPKDASGYTITRPQMPDGMQWDEGEEKAYLEHAAKMRVPQHIAQQSIDFMAARRIEERTKVVELETAEKANLDGLYKEWGLSAGADGKFDTANSPQVQIAQRAFRAAGMDGDVAKEIEGFIGGARMMKLFAKLGEGLKESVLHEAIGGLMPTGEAALKAELASIEAKMQAKTATPEEVKRRSAIFDALHPGKAEA